MDNILIIFALFLSLIGIILIVAELQKKKRQNEIDDYCKNNNICIDQRFNYGNYTLIFDNHNGFMYYDSKDTSGDIKRFSYYSINGFDTTVNDKKSGGIKRGIVGGILAGEVGALIGASTAKNYITSYKATIYITDLYNPIIEMNLINSKTKANAPVVSSADKFTQGINGMVKAIIATTQQNVNIPHPAPNMYPGIRR